MDRLHNYHTELQDIKDKFFEFSEQVLSYSMENLSTTDPLPKDRQGNVLDFDYWDDAQARVQKKMNDHELEIRKKASDLAANKDLTEFERQTLEIQKR